MQIQFKNNRQYNYSNYNYFQSQSAHRASTSRYSLSIVLTSPNSIVRQFPGCSRPAPVSSFVDVLATSVITSARSSVQLLCPASLLSSSAPAPPALLATAIPAAGRRLGVTPSECCAADAASGPACTAGTTAFATVREGRERGCLFLTLWEWQLGVFTSAAPGGLLLLSLRNSKRHASSKIK